MGSIILLFVYITYPIFNKYLLSNQLLYTCLWNICYMYVVCRWLCLLICVFFFTFQHHIIFTTPAKPKKQVSLIFNRTCSFHFFLSKRFLCTLLWDMDFIYTFKNLKKQKLLIPYKWKRSFFLFNRAKDCIHELKIVMGLAL